MADGWPAPYEHTTAATSICAPKFLRPFLMWLPLSRCACGDCGDCGTRSACGWCIVTELRGLQLYEYLVQDCCLHQSAATSGCKGQNGGGGDALFTPQWPLDPGLAFGLPGTGSFGGGFLPDLSDSQFTNFLHHSIRPHHPLPVPLTTVPTTTTTTTGVVSTTQKQAV